MARRSPPPPWTLLALLTVISQVTHGFIDLDGVCSVFVFVPFSLFGLFDAGGLTFNNKTNYGFSHTAAALLAAEHFNSRDTRVVPELASLTDCKITLKIENNSVFDTGSYTQMASQSLVKDGRIPCAIAGPFHDFPTLELSVLAQAHLYPIVVHRGFNPRIVSNFYHRYTTQVYPDLLASSRTLVDFLYNQVQRTNYISFLYSFTDVNVFRRETVAFEFDTLGMEWYSAVYLNPLADDTSAYSTGERTPLQALSKIKETGFRTIVVAMDNGGGAELEAIANAAEQLGMNNGDYFYMWFDVLDPSYINKGNVSKIASGSAWLLPLNAESFRTNTQDAFSKAWSEQGQVQVNRLNHANPVSPGQGGYKFAEPDFFQTVPYEYGSSFMYDAVMSIGMGACRATQNSQNTTVSGIDHVTGIRQARFTGASGPVGFGSQDEDRNGTRLPFTVSWGILNLLHRGMETTHILTPHSNGTWEELVPFVYRDGRTEPPTLLRDAPSQNYLRQGLHVFGLTIMSVAIAAALASAVFVYIKRKHRVFMASQPVFLYLICFGAALQASAIFTISFDESYEWTGGQLSSACMATPWLLTLGHTIVYASLFTKMWRVHKVLQFARRQIKLSHVAWPMLALVVFDLVILSLWTALDPLYWQREEINELTGESIGQCVSDQDQYWAIVVTLVLVPTIMTGYFAWKTKDVDSAYSESSWIFMMILIQLEVAVVAAPVVVLLQDVNTNGRYLGFALLIWSFPTSVLGCIMVPKFISYHRAVCGFDAAERHTKRGARTSIRVSGVTISRGATASSSNRTTRNGENVASLAACSSRPNSNETRHLEPSLVSSCDASRTDETLNGTNHVSTNKSDQGQSCSNTMDEGSKERVSTSELSADTLSCQDPA